MQGRLGNLEDTPLSTIWNHSKPNCFNIRPCCYINDLCPSYVRLLYALFFNKSLLTNINLTRLAMFVVYLDATIVSDKGNS